MKTLVRTFGTPVFLGLLLAGRGALARQEGDSPEARFIRSARAAIESGREAAAARLREAKEAVAAQARDDAERDQRLARALQESTSRVPLRVSLDRNAVLDNVRVSGYAAGVVTLTWPQGEVQVPLAGLADDARSAMVSIALSRGNARDCYELGKLLLRGRDFEGAARAFAASVRLDPALAPAVPDVDRLRKAARLFEGQFKLSGNTLSLRWGFSSPAEAGDFQALQGASASRPARGWSSSPRSSPSSR